MSKYLPQMPDETDRRYLIVAIDRATGWVFVRIHADQTEVSSCDFVFRLYQAAPMKITQLLTDEGWLFLAVVIDLFSRQVVGWSLRQDMTRDIVIDALRMAWFKRHPGKDTGLIFHSDRGSQ